jgi:cobalt-zinc-cadmium resistance protein CzcA
MIPPAATEAHAGAMIHSVTQYALSQRLLTLLLTLLLAVAGYRAFRELPIDAFPDVSPTQVKIIVKAPGMTPEEVETRITNPIELEVLGIPRQRMLRSTTKYALADITIDFREGTDIYWARQQVSERLGNVWSDLPDGVSGGIAPMTTPLGEMFMFTLEGPHSLARKRSVLDWIIRPALRTVEGVADVNALGGYVRSFEIIPDNDRLATLGLDPVMLEAIVRANNGNDGAGRLTSGEETLLVRAEGRINTAEDLEQLVVRSQGGAAVRLGDVAEVREGSITRYGAVTQNGEQEAVQGLVLSLRGANAREVIAGVRDKLADIAGALPEGMTVDVFYDRGTLVGRAVATVTTALAQAAALVVVLLVLFLGNLRAAVTVAMVLPLAALVTFVLMDQFGMSANLMSLGGLAIAIGMLVDSAVVVVENIEKTLVSTRDVALPKLHRIYRAVRQVALPIVSSTLIIIVVFLPLLALRGLEGKLFTPVALTIVFALAGALVLSLTVIPVLASFLIHDAGNDQPWLPRQLEAAYLPALDWCCAHPRTTVTAAGIGLIAALLVLPFVGRSFIPTLDEGDIIVQLEKLPSITLEESVDLDMRVQAAVLNQVPEVRRIVTRVGSDEIGMDPMGLNESDKFMVLSPPEDWRARSKQALKDAIREVLDQFPGIAYGFTQPIEMRTSEMLTGTRGDVAVKVFGNDLGELNSLAENAARIIASVPGAEDVFASRNEGVQYLEVLLDKRAARRLGLDARELQRRLRAQLEGLEIGVVIEGIRRIPILMRAPRALRESPQRFAELPLAIGDGDVVSLGQVADIRRVDGVVSIRRERGQRFAQVQANVTGRDLVGFVDEARARVAAELPLPTGYYIEWGGEFENQQRAAGTLAAVLPVALGLIFLLLFSTFGSVRLALLVLANIPLALIGGIFALWLTGEYLSVPASVGFIALLGIAVQNGVMLVTYFNELRASGVPLEQTIRIGAQRRLRPVLMTATTAAFGLAPLLFATGPGSEIQRPLAIVVIGGLISATSLTLVVLPLLYRRFAEPAHDSNPALPASHAGAATDG